ncbi:MAG: hypothetical protein EBR82_27100 [Caulobacteraceae bacterium]|nr:hypothetical protein [Caulobacteraceae bacterium]
MSNMLDDGVASMVGSLLAVAGSVYTYTRGSSSATVTMRRTTPENETLDDNGQYVSTKFDDFLIGTSDMPYGDPVQGDRISTSSTVYEVQPRGGEQVFRRSNPSMTRIFTIQVQR